MIEVYECHELTREERERYKIVPQTLTRGERIRRMTDEELAELLLSCGYEPCAVNPYMPLADQCCKTNETTWNKCERCLAEWLGQKPSALTSAE